MIYVSFLAGLFVGMSIVFLLCRYAYNKQYSREKRAEKIKRQLDEEERMNGLIPHTPIRIYSFNPSDVEAIINGKSYTGYLTQGQIDRFNALYHITLAVEAIRKEIDS